MQRQRLGLLSRTLLAGALSSVYALSCAAGQAQDISSGPAGYSMEQRVEELERQVQVQQGEIAALKRMLIDAHDNMLALTQGRGLGAPVMQAPLGSPSLDARGLAVQAAQAPVSGAAPNLPGAPVGEAPAEDETAALQARVQAVPEGQGVLTPAGQLSIEPSLEYVLSSTNRLVFRGVELVPGLPIGVIEASDARRDTVALAGTIRYGLTNRLEAEVRVPWLYRNDKIEEVRRQQEDFVRTLRFKEKNLGDVEFGLRYQLNRPRRPQQPVFVAGLRVKSDTGIGPFEIAYDQNGIPLDLTTGSGFWAVSPSVSFLLPSDPVVIYGGASYFFHLARDVNKLIGTTPIGRVDPGDAVAANLGFGFALNPRFSFSLGYRHSYILATTSEIGPTIQKSDKLHVGALLLGMSYRVTERTSLNFGFEFGVTEDAPDVGISLRVPFSFEP